MTNRTKHHCHQNETKLKRQQKAKGAEGCCGREVEEDAGAGRGDSASLVFGLESHLRSPKFYLICLLHCVFALFGLLH